MLEAEHRLDDAEPESIVIDAGSTLRHIDCPARMRCDTANPPSGFLASAVILSAIRQQRLSGRYPILPTANGCFASRPSSWACMSRARPLREIHSGAVIAQRHRRSGEIDGPSLDPWSIESIGTPAPISSRM